VDAGTIMHTKTESLGAISADTIRQAHARVESGRMIGKVTLRGIAE
jgi:hypothetical protein